MSGKSWALHGKGRLPNDKRFTRLLLAMEIDAYLPFELPSPDEVVAGNGRLHPYQHRLNMFAQYHGRVYRSFKHGNKLYIVRIE
jgi:hypothetical protein